MKVKKLLSGLLAASIAIGAVLPAYAEPAGELSDEETAVVDEISVDDDETGADEAEAEEAETGEADADEAEDEDTDAEEAETGEADADEAEDEDTDAEETEEEEILVGGELDGREEAAGASGNAGRHDYIKWTSPTESYLTETDTGFMRVQGVDASGSILVEYYNSSFVLQSSKTIPAELPIFGAFHSDGENYYLLTGQTNVKENDSVEVFRITKYDKDWKRLGSDGLFGANTTVPFDAGSARMVSSGKYLLIRTCHEMYTYSDGYNHQANVTIQFDTEKMKITDSYTIIMNYSRGYVSHSFNQFILADGNHIVGLDHGDDHPRSVVLSKYRSDFTTGAFAGYVDTAELIVFPDSNVLHYNYTGAALGGFEMSDTNYIVVGNINDQKNFDTSDTRNIFVVTIDRELKGSPKLTKLTSHKEGTESASNPFLVKTGANSFTVIWSRDGKVYYTSLNGKGEKTGDISSIRGELSDCQPILAKNGKIVWYVWSGSEVKFYSIDPAGTAAPAVGTLPQPDLIKSTAGAGQATVVCSKVAGAVNYKLYYTTDNGKNYTTVGNSKTRKWVVTGLKAGTEYKFLVRASDGKAWSAYKKGDCSAPVIPTLSGPATINAVFVPGKIVVGCTAVKGGVDYKLYYTLDGGKTYKGVGSAADRRWTILLPKPDVEYKFLVRVSDGKTWSAYTKGECYSPVYPTLPQPETIQSLAVKGEIRVKCTGVKAAVKYRLFYTTDNGKTYTKVGDSTDRSWVLTGLTPGVEYKFLVLACDGKNWSNYKKGDCSAPATAK